MTPLSPPPHSGDWYKPCLPQRGSYPVSSEPHYSVPKNNTKVGSHVTNSLHHYPGHPSSSSSVNGVTNNSNVVVVEDICHIDHNNHDGQNGHTNRTQPEVDKTPTNEAGKMQDALEKVRLMVYIFKRSPWISNTEHIYLPLCLKFFIDKRLFNFHQIKTIKLKLKLRTEGSRK